MPTNEMGWTIIIVILLVLVLVYRSKRKISQKEAPPETYVCNICGHDECVCHKDHIDTQA